MPASPFIRSSTFRLSGNTTITRSPLTRQVQAVERPGAHWIGEYVLPPMDRARAAAWQAFGAALRGEVGTFYGFDPDARQPRGSAGGAPKVNGAGQAGRALVTNGWPVSTTGVLLRGDYFQVGTELKIMVEDADSDAAGVATLHFEPTLRASPVDASALIVANPRGIFRLAGADVEWDADSLGIYGMAFAIEEDF